MYSHTDHTAVGDLDQYRLEYRQNHIPYKSDFLGKWASLRKKNVATFISYTIYNVFE